MLLSRKIKGSGKWKLLWDFLVSLKVRCFGWLLLRDKLAVMDRLQFMGFIQAEGNFCCFCEDDREDSIVLVCIDCGLGLQG